MTTTLSGDSLRLRATVDVVTRQDTAALLPLLLPGLDGPELDAVAARCRFAHAAVLVFPADRPELDAALAACGLAAGGTPVPSVVVRDRIAARHGRPAADLDVGILRPPVTGADGARRCVEVFVLPVPPGSDLAGLAAHERERQHEAHLAFEAVDPDPLLLRGLCAAFARHGAVPDGGGHNPHEDGTVLYFAVPGDAAGGYRRVELYAAGAHPDVLAAHLAECRRRQPADTLLRLMTGAWTTQAIAVFAELRVADAMDEVKGAAAEDLAAAVGADPDGLARLLRFLAVAGVVAREGDGFRLAGPGVLLRSGTTGSMRALAGLYGGPFYTSFADLGFAVRTGGDAFAHRFGAHHFAYFAADPERAELFDGAMAASSVMFEPLPRHPAVAAAAAGGGTVVDVAGGNGELLRRVLAAHPGLRGVLLERPHAVAAARRALDAAGLGGRCAFRAGDFADVPGGGDVYLLSRVLHDWDDARCGEILRHVAAAMPDGAELLVVERVPAADGSASLAAVWDLHMLCNVGGRERTAEHYGRLLAAAGLELVEVAPLPLDGSVLRARRAARTGAPAG